MPRAKPGKKVALTRKLLSKVLHGDNLTAARQIPDQTISTIYIDPPFGTGTKRTGAKNPITENAAEERNLYSYPDFLVEPDAFVQWLSPLLVESKRVLTKSGSIFVHLDYRTVHYVKVALDGIFGRDRFVNELIWCYSVGGKSNKRFARKHDTILWYSKESGYAFYPEFIRVPRKGGSHMRVRTLPDGTQVQEKTDKKTGRVYQYPMNQGKIPEDWWTDIETLNRSDSERVGWPTQKPERLLRRILLGTTQKNDAVADWFSGSGTTAAVAAQHERRFVAVDISKDAVDITAKRISKHGPCPAVESVLETGNPQ